MAAFDTLPRPSQELGVSRSRLQRRSNPRRFVVGTIAALALIATTGPVAYATDPSIAASEAGVETREAFGLPVDAATMAQLAAERSDASFRWGFPLTDAEEAYLDIPGRMAFVQELEKDVLPYVRSLDSFAGVWID